MNVSRTIVPKLKYLHIGQLREIKPVGQLTLSGLTIKAEDRYREWVENESHPSTGLSMTEKRPKNWIEKAGMIGFLFFLAKGLLWLAAAGAAVLFLR